MFAVIASRATRPPMPGARRARGFSLIEVLVALLILAFGLLGLAFLQVLSVRYTQSAAQRTVATNLAYEVLDMMRANREAAAQYTQITEASFGGVAVPPTGCERGDENGVTAWQGNMIRWRCEVRAGLPAGVGSVVMNGNEVTVSLSWSDDVGRKDDADAPNAPGKTTTFAMTTQL